MSKRKLQDIDRYLRTWQGQVEQAVSQYKPIKIGDAEVDPLNAKPLVDRLVADLHTIVDGVAK